MLNESDLDLDSTEFVAEENERAGARQKNVFQKRRRQIELILEAKRLRELTDDYDGLIHVVQADEDEEMFSS